MIEAAAYTTPYQRQLYDHYAEIHRKFFPDPPPVPKAIAKPEPEPIPEPAPPPPEPLKLPMRMVPGIGPDRIKMRMRVIRRMVCQEFNINKEIFMSRQRANGAARPRQVFSYLASRLTRASLPMIGQVLKNDHTTVMHAIARIESMMVADHDFGARVLTLQNRICEQFTNDQTSRTVIGRYVPHHKVIDYLMLGWMWAPLNEYVAIMTWPCSCQYAEPKE